jgi:hypothetical protein
VLQNPLLTISMCYKFCYLRFLRVTNTVTCGFYVLQILLLTVSTCYKFCYLRFLRVTNSVTYGFYVLHIFVTYAFIQFVPP